MHPFWPLKPSHEIEEKNMKLTTGSGWEANKYYEKQTLPFFHILEAMGTIEKNCDSVKLELIYTSKRIFSK